MSGENVPYFCKSGEYVCISFKSEGTDMPSLFAKNTDLDLGLTPISGVSWLWLIELTFLIMLGA